MRASCGLSGCFVVAALIVSVRENTAFAEDPAPSAALQGARAMSLGECVAQALRNNIDIGSANLEVDVTTAERGRVRGQFLPKIHVDAYAQQWTEPYNIPFSLTPGQPPANFPVHDAFQWNATVSATQPITGL